jgi:hypothetical protein
MSPDTLDSVQALIGFAAEIGGARKRGVRDSVQ